MKQLEEIDKALKLVENIVLYGTFVDLCCKLEEDVIMRMVRNNLCDKIECIIDSPKDKKLAAWQVMKECLNEQNTIYIQCLIQVRSIKRRCQLVKRFKK